MRDATPGQKRGPLMQEKTSATDDAMHAQQHNQHEGAHSHDHYEHEQHENIPLDEHAPHHEQSATEHAGHGDGKSYNGHVDHSGHEQMFRRRFWVCLVLSIPVLLYSPMLQHWFGFTMPTFTGSEWVEPLFAVIVFAYGGVPFLRMAVPEIRTRQPGMMTLISLAITVALAYSLAALVIDPEGGFFWELVLLIDVMLLGHWLEMRSVR
jgi:P-type Cu2+ transporter